VLTAAVPIASTKASGQAGQTANAPPGAMAPPGDWPELVGAIISGHGYHAPLVSIAARLIGSGMHDGTAVNLLRALMDASAGPRDERWQGRYDDIPRTVSTAREKFGQAQEGAAATEQSTSVPQTNLCAPYVWRDPATLPIRGWLYGKHYIRQYVSGSIGEGGVGKSTISLTEAVVMVVRLPLLGKMPTARNPLKIWYWNGEDPKAEIELRLAAICQHFEIDGRKLEDKLFVDGRDCPISIAAMNRNGALALNDAIIRLIADKITQNQIDVLILDPFIAIHRVPENDNMSVDQVIKALGRIAENTNAAVEIDHHTRKTSPGQESLTISDARGGSAIIYGVRSGRIFNQMTAAEADKAGINPDARKAYFRFDRTKANMAPPEFAVWHRLVPVTIANGEEVAVAEPWKFPDIFEGVTTVHMHAVRQKAQDQDYRADIRSKNWIGYAVIEVLKLGRSAKDKTRVKNILRKWYENGVLMKVEKEDAKSRKPFEFVVPGDWHE
jgi:hypothetical protein